jgi:hypothetical protein
MRTPPKLATRLIEYFGCGPRVEHLIGDLFEEFQCGRSDLWYWRQALTVLLGGPTVFRIAVSILSLALVVAVSGLMAFAAFFHSAAWHGGAAGMFGSFTCLILLLLLIQRAAWKSFPLVLHRLFWPTAVTAAILVLGGVAVMINDVRLGSYVALIGVLAAFGLWRTRSPRVTI